jgi:hypothetical protein
MEKSRGRETERERKINEGKKRERGRKRVNTEGGKRRNGGMAKGKTKQQTEEAVGCNGILSSME